MLSKFDLNISPKSFLTYFEYSDDGILYTQDDKGVIRMEIGNQYWLVVHRSPREKFYWCFAVIEKLLIVYELRGNRIEPSVDEKYQTLKISPKSYPCSLNSEI